jgi:ribonuclease R
LLKKWQNPTKNIRLPSLEELTAAGNMLSACEQRAVKVERQFNAIKKARFMSRFLGEEFEGIISSVTRFGLFIMLRAYDVDGLIRVEDLGDERFEFDEKNLSLRGTRSGAIYSIGTLITVQVARADSEAGQIDFVLPGKEKVEPDSIRKTYKTHSKTGVSAKKHQGGAGKGSGRKSGARNKGARNKGARKAGTARDRRKK